MFPLNDAQDGHKKATKIATTQPTTQNKTKQLGWCGIIMSKNPITTPHLGPVTTRAVIGNPRSWFSVCNLISPN